MERHYRFPPRRTSGVVGKLSITQMLVIVAAIALPWLGVQSGSLALFVFLLVAGGGLIFVAFVRVGGRYLTEWLGPVVGVVVDRLRGTAVYRGAVFGPSSLAHRMDLPGDLASLRMIAAVATDGQQRIGLVVDEGTKVVTAALLTEGTPVVLEETAEQESRLNEWEAVMESTCDQDAAITRWQLLFRSMPDATNTAQAYYLDRAVQREELPARALYELVSRAAPSAQRHEVFLVVAFDLQALAAEIKASGGDDTAIGVVVMERLLELERQISEARIPVRGWLTPGQYAAVLHSQFDPDSLPLYDMQSSAQHELDLRVAGPSATERQWTLFRHDSAVSSTLWVHELPRRPVKSNWLAPLLQQSDVRRSISLVVQPLPPHRAERSVSNQALAAAGNIHMRQSHGLLVDARTQKELAAAQQLDDELAEGAGYFRYSMFVTVTAPDAHALRRSVAAVRRRLTRVRCSSMVLFGEQDQGFFAGALPLARGLAPMRGVTGS
ncbi:lipoprotein [Longimycelium tulufanense]|uniref:Lipoprotein n=1 Tax=Longimycelium tulufanense TaxID=907463 RepID=A0A8J3CB27_9PSEU|nr:SCO6880 family protein [Longimycelium tulufanense]GGM67874.1 lipoprotein [Longimycelium tulufanense]